MPRTAKGATAPREAATTSDDPSEYDVANLNGWRGRVVNRSLERATLRSLDRGQAFIDAAVTLMRQSGSDGFTLQAVADIAGQSLRTFYQHFASKNDLLLAVFEDEVRRHAETIRQAVELHEDPLERLATFVIAGAGSRGNLQESMSLARYRTELVGSRPEDLALVQAPVVALAKELVTAAVDAGAIPPCNPDSAAYVMVTLKSALLNSTILGNELGVVLPDRFELARFCIEGLNGHFPSSLNRTQ